jgi:hypothetical protein
VSIFKVYVGDLEDPEFQNGEEGPGSIVHPPRAVSPDLPLSEGYLAFNLVCKIGSGDFSGRQIHAGCWVAKVTRAQIVHFIYEYYIWWQLYHHYEDGTETPLDECGEILNCVKNLDAGKYYGLVACECWSAPAAPFETTDYRPELSLSRLSLKQRHPA